MKLYVWAHKWGIPFEAVIDLMTILGSHPPVTDRITSATSETSVSNLERLKAAKNGGLLWRNNVGAMQNESGAWIRFGLANESKQMNERTKSSDLIGIRPVLITQEMVGITIGQFMARECKKPSWVYEGTPRERAQLRFIELVTAKGGDAQFTTGAPD